MMKSLLAMLSLLLLTGVARASTEGVWYINDDVLFAQGTASSSESGEANKSSSDRAIELYEQATSALDDRNWDRAAEKFQAVIDLREQRVDASLYWLAYSLNKLNRRADALDALAKLQSGSFSDSRWREDGKALEYQIRSASGQKVAPEATTDEDLKLMIINNLIHSDPDQAIPLLQKLLKGDDSPKIKERALFVLAQSDTPEAQQILADYARGSGEPEMQMKAVEYLGIFGNKANTALLEDVYRSNSNRDVKRKILESFMLAGEGPRLLSLAKTEPDPELRRKAIEQLGLLDASDALWDLYQAESDDDVKRKIIESFMLADDAPHLLEIARGKDAIDMRRKAIEQLGLLDESDALWQIYKDESSVELRRKILDGIWLSGNIERLIDVGRTESNVDLRRSAIEKIGLSDGERARQALMAIYQAEKDPDIKERVLSAMFLQDNDDGLITIARTDKDPKMRRSAVEKLSMMDSKAATEFLLELLQD